MKKTIFDFYSEKLKEAHNYRNLKYEDAQDIVKVKKFGLTDTDFEEIHHNAVLIKKLLDEIYKEDGKIVINNRLISHQIADLTLYHHFLKEKIFKYSFENFKGENASFFEALLDFVSESDRKIEDVESWVNGKRGEKVRWE